jgi:hypothetical protein
LEELLDWSVQRRQHWDDICGQVPRGELSNHFALEVANISGYANNQAEVSHQPTRERERHMRRFKSVAQAQRFLAVHDVVRNLFTVGRHRLRAGHQRLLRSRAFVTWNDLAAA